MSVPVALDDVTLGYRDGRRVLDAVNLVLLPGEFVGLFGANGAGKTTLLRAILGLIAPAKGEIRVFSERARPGRPGVSYLPQTGRTPPPPLRGWDVLAASGAASEVGHALALTGAEELAMRRMTALSGGERQRVLIAQALMGSPRLLLLDEPLAGLDPRHQAEMAGLLRRLQRDLQLTVLCSAHELNVLLPVCDRVLYLANGKAALGPADDVVTGPVLTRLYGAPVSVVRAEGRVFVAA